VLQLLVQMQLRRVDFEAVGFHLSQELSTLSTWTILKARDNKSLHTQLSYSKIESEPQV
jgi:hypothetical protein